MESASKLAELDKLIQMHAQCYRSGHILRTLQNLTDTVQTITTNLDRLTQFTHTTTNPNRHTRAGTILQICTETHGAYMTLLIWTDTGGARTLLQVWITHTDTCKVLQNWAGPVACQNYGSSSRANLPTHQSNQGQATSFPVAAAAGQISPRVTG